MRAGFEAMVALGFPATTESPAAWLRATTTADRRARQEGRRV